MEINAVQALVEQMSREWQRGRATTQMTLGGLIEVLRALPADAAVIGFGRPRSYRGYYCDLAFEPTEGARDAADLLRVCEGCMDRVFVGYKGGDYLMGETTPIWLASYGDTGLRLMGLEAVADAYVPVLAAEEEKP